MNIEKHRFRGPWSLWFIGILFLFLYAYGVYDFVMMLGHNVEYYSSNNYGDEVFEYFTDYPVLTLMLWIINIVSGVIAPILLLFRSRWAVMMALISAISILILQFITFAFMNRWNVFGPWVSLFDIAIMLMTFGLFVYCKAMAKRDVLI
ncbi:hypothetical protein [Desulfuribacillus alkaliarsenatis]|uniref:Uncharacterized protein n=1 Tax=Desulfuribacillus alkaliarsenatis TaxID=766136 RepID=A0A1E5G1C2_9FIRM|nr:hypothetical protein [Desulfuribacillus alkaliarsenatis]OEF96663.1 hypothetical protein BHF68_06175 [Desulfuribacillus alkaliarsenatis]